MQSAIWSEKNYLTYLSGSIFSTQGIWIQRMTLGWMLWQQTHSESLLGILAFLLFVPSIIFGPLFGVLVDRVDRRKAALTTSLILAFISLCLALLTQKNLINDVNLLFFALIIGISNSAYQAIRLSFVPELVSKENMPKAVAINAIIYNTSRFIGPMIAGYLIKYQGEAVSLFLVAAFYLPLIFVLNKLRLKEYQAKNKTFTFISDIKAGFSYTLKSAIISKLLLLICISAILGRGLLEILPAAAEMLYQGGVEALAWLNSAAGIGAIVAGFVLSKFSSKQLLTALKIAIVSSGFLICGFNFMTGLELGLVLIALLSFSATVCGVSTQSLIQISVDSQFRGRVMSLWGAINLGGAAIGGLIFGIATEFIGYEIAFILLGLICVFISYFTSRKISL
ncbi:MFS transporter [Marinomonas sp. PE14-40]|uniref:MFS transporter n=1 Tax=Marinomonas sp. PE14-40 TaxID=3060621 RepID=UPI003F66CE64